MRFGEVSLSRLGTCHPDLQRLFLLVVKKADCAIVCGHRGQQEQDEAFEKGFSKLKWPHGKHNKMPSVAVDVAPSPIDWKDEQRFHDFAKVVKETAKEAGIDVAWGGDWQSFVDLPHWELKGDV